MQVPGGQLGLQVLAALGEGALMDLPGRARLHGALD